MAFNAGAVRGTLELDAKEFISALKKANVALDKIEKNSKQAAKGVSGFAGKIGLLRDAIIILPAAFRLLKAPFGALKRGMSDIISTFAEFEAQVRDFAVAAQGAGVKGIANFTQAFRDFASEMQNTTTASDGMVISIGALLLNLGAPKEKLKEFTKAVLDYAAATGRNAADAARLFAKSLGGSLGELSEQLPELVGTSKEALKLGAAFKFAGDRFGGFSEKIATTLSGSFLQIKNVFDDLKKAIGEELEPTLVEFGQAVSKALQEAVKFAKENGQAIRENFANMAAALLTAFAGMLDAMASVSTAFFSLYQAAQMSLPAIAGMWGEIVLQALRLNAVIQQFKANVLGGLNPALNEIAKQAREAVEEQERAVKAMAEAYDEIKTEQEKVGKGIKILADGVHKAADFARTFAGKMVEAGAATKRATDEAAALADATHSASKATAERLKHLREITGVDPSKPMEELVSQIQSANGALTETVAKSGKVAENFGRAAASAGATGGGGGGADDFASFGGPSAGDSRRRGGRAGFDTSSIAGLQQAIAASSAGARASVGGLYSRQARKSAHIVGQQLRAKMGAMLDQQMADFTSGLVEELNRAGIFDPAQRQTIIDQQLDEAKRLGIIQKPPGLSSFF